MYRTAISVIRIRTYRRIILNKHVKWTPFRCLFFILSFSSLFFFFVHPSVRSVSPSWILSFSAFNFNWITCKSTDAIVALLVEQIVESCTALQLIVAVGIKIIIIVIISPMKMEREGPKESERNATAIFMRFALIGFFIATTMHRLTGQSPVATNGTTQ